MLANKNQQLVYFFFIFVLFPRIVQYMKIYLSLEPYLCIRDGEKMGEISSDIFFRAGTCVTGLIPCRKFLRNVRELKRKSFPGAKEYIIINPRVDCENFSNMLRKLKGIMRE